MVRTQWIAAMGAAFVAAVVWSACADDRDGTGHPDGIGNYCEVDDDCGVDHCPDGSACVAVGNTDNRGCEPDP